MLLGKISPPPGVQHVRVNAILRGQSRDRDARLARCCRQPVAKLPWVIRTACSTTMLLEILTK
jgi:hypothetical protein